MKKSVNLHLDEHRALDINLRKEDTRISINITLLGICFTLFTFLIAFNPSILTKNIYLTLQLTLAIPLFMSSILARAKSGYTLNTSRWKKFGFVTYLIAYAFLINVMGMFLILFVSLFAGLIFFIINIILAIIYSILEVSHDKPRFSERFIKDLTFILILILLGILPAMGFY